MSGLRILITNSTMAERTGTPLYVRDLATALLDRGHRPVVYSPALGDVARELRAATVPVVDDLAAVGAPPDLIHGQHHLQTMMALLRFPATPGLFVCHGWTPWEEIPPKFPRLLRYVAVDYTCFDRIVLEHGIPEDRVSVLLNFVDLERFRPRAPLPDRPRRALLFSNHGPEHVHAVGDACRRAGLTLEVLGASFGRPSASPETSLGDYDVVFAKARSALEALAVGPAVVLCGVEGAGPMVTTQELDRLRRFNFGVRTLQWPVASEILLRELGRYDAGDAAAVSRRIRAEAGRDQAVDAMVALYRDVLDEWEGASRDAGAELQAAAAYLDWLGPRLRSMNGSRHAVGVLLKAAFGRWRRRPVAGRLVRSRPVTRVVEWLRGRTDARASR